MRAEPTEELLPHYLAELAALRGAGAAFARRYPQVAGRLELDSTGSADPHVERLIESFAFLNARLQRLHEAQSPEIARSLLEVVRPSLVAPVPSMAVAAFTPRPAPSPVRQRARRARRHPTLRAGQRRRGGAPAHRLPGRHVAGGGGRGRAAAARGARRRRRRAQRGRRAAPAPRLPGRPA